jgi:hypothetical protein
VQLCECFVVVRWRRQLHVIDRAERAHGVPQRPDIDEGVDSEEGDGSTFYFSLPI